MEDYIINATAAEGTMRAYAAYTRATTEQARQIHQTTPVVTAALGRLMTATVMMGSMLKGDNIVTCRINGNGPVRGIVATANADGFVKGYPYNPLVELQLNAVGKLDVSGAIGAGTLTVSKDLGLKEPYTGQVALVSGEIAEDFAQYYLQSEQSPSAVALGVLVDRDYTVKQAGGLIIQLMPGAAPEAIDTLSERVEQMQPVTTQLDAGKTPEDILADLFQGMDLKINDRMPCAFRCNCSREKLYQVVVALGKDELNDILEKEKEATLRCHFCNSEYHFDEKELRDILEQAQ